MACAAFEDSLVMAKEFQTAVNTFTADTSEANLEAARVAYKKMRKPYQQAEIMRFDEPFAVGTTGIENVDAWEGGLNAWPLDESQINFIVNKDDIGSTDTVNEDLIDANNGVDANNNEDEAAVTTGFHAIEYVLWDRDENSEGPGSRAASEFANIDNSCTDTSADGDCRLSQYLTVATDKVVADLEDMVAQWDATAISTDGSLAQVFLDNDEKVDYIFQSVANMSVGELGGARLSAGLWRDASDLESIQIGADATFKEGDREEEHDCFSDLSHYAVYYNFIGVANALQGSYTRVDGSVVSGPSFIDFVEKTAGSAYSNDIINKLGEAKAGLDVVFAAGEDGSKSFDQIIGDSEATYANGEAKTAELEALEAAITALGETEPLFTEAKRIFELDGFEADAIGETD
jgi:putative iron-regulated protein